MARLGALGLLLLSFSLAVYGAGLIDNPIVGDLTTYLDGYSLFHDFLFFFFSSQSS